jgi:hypothetical protein
MEKAFPRSAVVFFFRWVPYAIAACLMALGIFQAKKIMALKSDLLASRTDAARLRESNTLAGLRLETLEARDASYGASRIVVAWDPYQHRGVVAAEDLPPASAGHDYQLWVLDPAEQAPVSAGILTGSRPFLVKPVSMPSPGFAVSLEPTGGSPLLTGPILFAVAPGP